MNKDITAQTYATLNLHSIYLFDGINGSDDTLALQVRFKKFCTTVKASGLNP